MMALRERLYTADEFFEIAELPENDEKRLELDEGEIVEMAASSPMNSIIAMRIGHFLNGFVIPRDLGYVTGADGGYRLGERQVRQPDVAFISKERAPKLPRRFTVAPDLAVEVVSPDEDVFKKANEYLHAGTKMVWAVYAEERTVFVMTLNEKGAVLSVPFTVGQTLDDGDVLPGFALAVVDIFVK